MVDTSPPSDAGGIAARRGFRIQDHVAARLAIDLLLDASIGRLECETADDIVLRRRNGAEQVIEYIQVKTTEKDQKWNLTELTQRVAGRKQSSVCEKSLLCDTLGETAWFRLVTTRDVSARLKPFTKRRARREGDTALDALRTTFAGKYKDVKSACGRSLADWAKDLLWEVESDERSLEARNVNALLKLAQARGVYPPAVLIEETYGRLVAHTRAMGDAPASEIDQKVWTRSDALAWWAAQLEAMRLAVAANVKVYQLLSTPEFFSELCSVTGATDRRSLYAYDVEYDGVVWRRAELIDHLLDWLPEVALSSTTLANYNHLEARRLPARALNELDRHGGTDIPRLIGTLILHAILRHHFGAEPIACKIFYSVLGTMRSTSAHIVPLEGGDEIWLGRSRLVTAEAHHQVVDEVLTELRTALTRDVLLEERDLIISLREPRHLRADDLGDILSRTGKTSELLKVIRLPILVAYDSETLNGGFDPDYVASLQSEVQTEFGRIKTRIGRELDNVEVSLFLVPIECSTTLGQDFEKKLRRP